jgi:hypothetical protein
LGFRQSGPGLLERGSAAFHQLQNLAPQSLRQLSQRPRSQKPAPAPQSPHWPLWRPCSQFSAESARAAVPVPALPVHFRRPCLKLARALAPLHVLFSFSAAGCSSSSAHERRSRAASFEPVFAAGRCACAAPDPVLCSGFQCSIWQTDSGFREQCKKRSGGFPGDLEVLRERARAPGIAVLCFIAWRADLLLGAEGKRS